MSGSPDLLPDGPRAVVLVGATASGKTDLAVRAAMGGAAQVEILALDSRQLYRDLDVATGKPDAQQRAAVPHHLIDLLDAHQTPQAMWYREQAAAVMREVWARGAVPFFVGGSGFYLRALREGFFDLDADPASLAAVRARVTALDDDRLQAELRRVDPESVERLHPHDRYRLARALEIAWLTGESATALQARFQPRPVLDARFEVFRLETERALLHERIERRTDAWLGGGWREEVEAMLGRGIPAQAPALRTLGYREVLRWIEGAADRAHTRDQIVIATRRYARQQATWFRKERGARVIGPGDETALRLALAGRPGAP